MSFTLLEGTVGAGNRISDVARNRFLSMRAGGLLYDRLSHPGQAFLNLECIVVRCLFATVRNREVL